MVKKHRKIDEPIQYHQGWVEFYKLKFRVDPRVLIPRPETELLVDEVIKTQAQSLLDIGTGSGNIAIAAVKKVSALKAVATDISGDALEVAKINAKYHQVEPRIEFVRSDLLSNIPDKSNFDFIATNLPYIPTLRIEVLDNSVKDFEPKVALDGGEDGFRLYQKLLEQLAVKQIKFGTLMAEIDYSQADLASEAANRLFDNKECRIMLDLAAKQRFLVIK